MNQRTYSHADFRKGYPAGHTLFYECLRCGETLLSAPENEIVQCRCHNITIDPLDGRMSVADNSQIRLYQQL